MILLAINDETLIKHAIHHLSFSQISIWYYKICAKYRLVSWNVRVIVLHCVYFVYTIYIITNKKLNEHYEQYWPTSSKFKVLSWSYILFFKLSKKCELGKELYVYWLEIQVTILILITLIVSKQPKAGATFRFKFTFLVTESFFLIIF